ncbi:MAG: glucans biosynthesis glucosyltransferase MdoH [Alphaproteobacteria bacterium]|nr:glucans biosynthesis glucosyltransferase MdoH [Alphaproteobacteria bacterium]
MQAGSSQKAMSVAPFPAKRPVDAAPHHGFSMKIRRAIFATLTGGTMLAALAALALLLAPGGFSLVETLMLGAFAVTLPWTVIGFWNAVIGFVLNTFFTDPLKMVCPVAHAYDPKAAVRGRTLIAMPVHNEDPDRVFRHLKALVHGLERGPDGNKFDIALLSDSTDPAIYLEEQRRFAAWREDSPHPDRLFYRRRTDNTGKKMGNLWEHLDRVGRDYDYLLVLDADSLMSASLVGRLARIMDRNPDLGILQTLAVGLPSDSPFTRLFQFGMRHGMRSFTMGSAWWQGDDGPYWGHNAVLRMRPFLEHCRLPELPGKAPFGGQILSHDQVEAVMMRRAGYAVRVIPEEGGSYEENPPTLPDFITRETRWCQGNLQYKALLTLPGLRNMGRLQLVLAMLMYLSPLAWMSFVLLGLAMGVTRMDGPTVGAVSLPWDLRGTAAGYWLLAAMLFMAFAPKIMGVLDVLLRPQRRQAYGGTPRVLSGFVVELIFSTLMAPIVALSLSIFAIGLFFGRSISWGAQNRSDYAMSWVDAASHFRIHFALAVLVTAAIAATQPTLLYWAAPILAGWFLATPFTVATSRLEAGRWMRRWGFAALPEEFGRPVTLIRAGVRKPKGARAANPEIVQQAA